MLTRGSTEGESKMYDNTETTLITYVGPSRPDDVEYVCVEIQFAKDFDLGSLPKSVRAHSWTTIKFTPTDKNPRNEAGIKRLRRIMKALEGRKVEVVNRYRNCITEDEFFARYA
jgi:hypothetical protein